MNKHDLVSAVANSVGMSMADAGKAVDGVFDNIASSLQAGNDVRLLGFGTFSVADRKATTGRNPRTGEPIYIPARRSCCNDLIYFVALRFLFSLNVALQLPHNVGLRPIWMTLTNFLSAKSYDLIADCVIISINDPACRSV